MFYVKEEKKFFETEKQWQWNLYVMFYVKEKKSNDFLLDRETILIMEVYIVLY